jgi:YHS domain-containing protein
MKKVALAIAVAALAVAPFAQTKPKALPTKVKCAVMTNEMVVVKDAAKKKLFADYKGKRYYFCCPGCVPPFKADPAKYAKNSFGFPIPKKG